MGVLHARAGWFSQFVSSISIKVNAPAADITGGTHPTETVNDPLMTDTHPQEKRSAGAGQRWAWILLGFLFVLSLGVLLVMPWPGSDFDAYHRAAVRVSHGENPYQLDEFGIHGTYRYPPAFAY